MKSRALLLMALTGALIMALSAGSAQAVTGVTIIDAGIDPWDYPYVFFSHTGTDDDGFGGYDCVMAVWYDGDGNVVDTDGRLVAVGATWTDAVWADPVFGTPFPFTLPVHMELRDIGDCSIPENDLSVLGQILAAPIVLAYNTGGFQGPAIPAGFVQYNITCDTPVYDAPGGTPVGDNMVTAGQTWHINPTDEAGWTAIFVNGAHLGYIPTSCVGGPTEFGALAE